MVRPGSFREQPFANDQVWIISHSEYVTLMIDAEYNIELEPSLAQMVGFPNLGDGRVLICLR